MTEPRRSVLLGSHDTAPLPDVAAVLRARGIDVSSSSRLAETEASLAAGAFDLVVLQPLSGSGDGFEVEQVRALGANARSFLLLVLPESGAARPLSPSDVPADDLLVDTMIGPPSADELLLRIALALRRRDAVLRVEQATRALEQETITDFKTGLHNDRYFFQRLRQEVERSRRHRLALSLVLVDLDDFKAVNDRFDHLFGDHVLAEFARRLRAQVRQIDVPARLGGDEFALLLPSTDLEEAAQLATRLRTTTGEPRFEKDGRSTALTVSMGIDALPGDEEIAAEEFLRRADLALLEAKRRGKSRICLYPEIAPKTTPA